MTHPVEQPEIRNATEADREDISRMIARVFRKDFAPVEPDEAKVARAIHKVVLTRRFTVALASDVVVGIVSCSDAKGRGFAIHSPQTLLDAGKLDEDSAYLEFVAVDEAHRRCGIAEKMLRFLMEHKPYAAYTLDVDDDNTAAIACYRKLGFAEFGRMPKESGGKLLHMRYETARRQPE